VTFLLNGETDSGLVAEREALMAAESKRLVRLDLADVTLVNREAITFLAGVEAAGAVFINCPEYVRSWIDAEQGSQGLPSSAMHKPVNPVAGRQGRDVSRSGVAAFGRTWNPATDAARFPVQFVRDRDASL
jgi:hypothetical protein